MPTGSGSVRVLSLAPPLFRTKRWSTAEMAPGSAQCWPWQAALLWWELQASGTAIPATRGELALLLWQNAGKPEPAALPAFADTADTETAKAAQWCTEQGLLTAEDGAFHPEQKVTKYRVIRVWKQAAAPQQ